jgi:hypothetical protein
MLNADAITGTGIFFVIRRKDGMKETGKTFVAAVWTIVVCVGKTILFIMEMVRTVFKCKRR